MELSYFSTIYKDRIVTPITFATQSLSDPTYAAFVRPNPTAAAQSSIIASTLLFGNYSGAAYVPANVVAIVDDSNVNAGRQTIHGVDVLAGYKFDLAGQGGSLDLQFDASYLESDQQLFAGQPVVQRAGLLFNPPHWRGRGGLTWSRDTLTLNGTVSYIGSVEDVQATPVVPVKAMTTLDLTGRYRFAHAPGVFRNLEIDVSAQNVLNDKPGVIATGTYADTTYDTTNYSPIGRFLSIGVTKKW